MYDIYTRRTRKRKKTTTTYCVTCGNELRANKTLRGSKNSPYFYCSSRCQDETENAVAFVADIDEVVVEVY